VLISKSLVLSVALLSCSASAKTVETGRWILTVTSASLLVATSSTLSAALTVAIPFASAAQRGPIEPLSSAGALLVGSALQLAFTWLLLPEVFRLSDVSPNTIRAAMWPSTRLLAAALGLSVLVYLVGAVLETNRYNTGQGVMLAGLTGCVVTGVAFDLFAVLGAMQKVKDSP
jgi:hypothetical protein